MKLCFIVLMFMSRVTVAFSDRGAWTDVPVSSYNNNNGGA